MLSSYTGKTEEELQGLDRSVSRSPEAWRTRSSDSPAEWSLHTRHILLLPRQELWVSGVWRQWFYEGETHWEPFIWEDGKDTLLHLSDFPFHLLPIFSHVKCTALFKKQNEPLLRFLFVKWLSRMGDSTKPRKLRTNSSCICVASSYVFRASSHLLFPYLTLQHPYK